jgi:hypothetical protein
MKALNEPGAAEQVAWEAVSAAVDKLHEFYAFSLHLDKIWPQILEKVCSMKISSLFINSFILIFRRQ